MFYKINQGLVGIHFPPEVSPSFRKHVSRLPNEFPYNHLPTRTNVYIGTLFIQELLLLTRTIIDFSSLTVFKEKAKATPFVRS